MIGRRALGPGRYVAKVHGSDLEYAVRLQDRYRELAREGLGPARAVLGPGAEAWSGAPRLVPEMRALATVVPPGVDVGAFRPRPRVRGVARRRARGWSGTPTRPAAGPPISTTRVERALAPGTRRRSTRSPRPTRRRSPSPTPPAGLRTLAGSGAPIVGYLGKLIPQKGVELVLAAQRAVQRDTEALIVGFGSHREWLAALAIALRPR